ncbi:MAG: type II secretion system protein [Betaproteobacteria bacterium]|nr:type II secretion system protein [Betaproteobacteria bacterium]
MTRYAALMKSHKPPTGFTITELVVTILIAGLLAAVAIPRFVGKDAFESRGFHDESLGVVRFAQKTAIAWRRQIFVCVTTIRVAAAAASGCAIPITHPATRGPLAANAPGGVTLPVPVEFRFDGAGRPLDGISGNPSGQITIPISSTIADDPARQIVVEAETGYVHP